MMHPADTTPPDPRSQAEPPDEQAARNAGTEATRSTVGGHGGGAPPTTSRRLPSGLRYRALRSHAKGGLGEVFVAEDLELHREVALKEIQPRFAEHLESRARFVLEAEVTGGLEHPGIVPVYGLGAYDDGRPFYAMRFIRGDNLKTATEAFHASPAASFESLEFRQLLGRFLDVCNAIAYAHSRGVLHRDLKPGNIMLGRFGETLVVDWGLAKVSGGSDAKEAESGLGEGVLRPSSGSGVSETAAGSVVGTPAYMSPEQACVTPSAIGPATDVYSLGATLFFLLANRPPFSGQNLQELIERVRAGRIEWPAASAIPAPLWAICAKAMLVEPSERYASALDLARDLENWLADEPVSAYAEPLADRTRRWMRKHPGLVAGIAASVLVGIVGLSIGSAVLGQKNQELFVANSGLTTANQKLDLANRELETTNGNLKIAREEADKKRIEAETQKRTALAVRHFLEFHLLRQADPNEQADRVRSLGDPEFVAVENPTIRELLQRAEVELAPARIEQTFPGEPIVQAEILATLGLTYSGIGEFEKSAAYLERARTMFLARVGPRDRQTCQLEMNLANAQLRAGRPEPATALLESVVQKLQKKFGPDDEDALNAVNSLACAYSDRGALDKALPLLEQNLERKRRALGPDHRHTFTAMNNLAKAYGDLGRYPEAQPLLEQTLAKRKAVLGPDHPMTLLSADNLAQCYLKLGRVKEAIVLHEATLAKRLEKLGAQHPQTLGSRHNLAIAYIVNQQLDKALAHLEPTLVALREKLPADHPDLLLAICTLAGVYRDSNRLAEAFPLYEGALATARKKLGADHRVTLELMNQLASAHTLAGQPEKAMPLYEEAAAAEKKFGPDHAATFINQGALGVALVRAERYQEAIPLLEKALPRIRSDRGPEQSETLRVVNSLGKAYCNVGRFADAVPLLRVLLAKARQQFGDDHLQTVSVIVDLGNTLRAAGRFDEAAPLYAEAANVRRAKLGAEHPDTMAVLTSLALAWTAARQYEKALPVYEAIQAARRATLGPDHPATWASTAMVAKTRLQLGQPEQALPLFADYLAAERKRQGPEHPEFALLLTRVGIDLVYFKQFAPAEAYFRECLAIREKSAPENWMTASSRSWLGEALVGQKKYAEAEPLLLAGWEGLKKHEAEIPPQGKAIPAQALQRLVDLYTGWEKPEEAAKWQKELTDRTR